MRIALIGLSNSGKTTIFNSLTGQSADVTLYPTTKGSPHIGVVRVPDKRLEKLSEIFKPKKTTYATVEYIEPIGITKGDMKQNTEVFEHIKDSDAFLHIVRAFEDERVIHPLGNMDPLRDVKIVEYELMFKDFELTEKRLSAIEQSVRKGKKPDEEEKRVLLKCKLALEKETPLRDVNFSDEELKAIRHLQFLSIKPEVIAINISEAELKGGRSKKTQVVVEEMKSKSPLLMLSGKLEMELRELSPSEARVFLNELGIDEPITDKLIRLIYEHLGLISFFTVLGDEVRAWTIKRGTSALNAAGRVHSDMEKGFIKAEVISFDDFIKAGSMSNAKANGLLRLEGKTYTVKDGDIINFRFGV